MPWKVFSSLRVAIPSKMPKCGIGFWLALFSKDLKNWEFLKVFYYAIIFKYFQLVDDLKLDVL